MGADEASQYSDTLIAFISIQYKSACDGTGAGACTLGVLIKSTRSRKLIDSWETRPFLFQASPDFKLLELLFT